MVDRWAAAILIHLRSHGRCRFKDFLGVAGSSRTVSKKLKKLLSMGLVTVEDGFYTLTLKGSEAAELMVRLLGLLGGGEAGGEVLRIPHTYYSALLSRYLTILMEHYGGRLLGVMVFGSVARGDWSRDSDIDLLVVVKGWDSIPVWRRIRELVSLSRILQSTPEYKASIRAGFTPVIQHYPLGPAEAAESRRIYIDACMDGIIIYEKEQFLSRILSKFRARLARLGARRIQLPDGKYYWVLKEGLKAGEVFEL